MTMFSVVTLCLEACTYLWRNEICHYQICKNVAGNMDSEHMIFFWELFKNTYTFQSCLLFSLSYILFKTASWCHTNWIVFGNNLHCFGESLLPWLHRCHRWTDDGQRNTLAGPIRYDHVCHKVPYSFQDPILQQMRSNTRCTPLWWLLSVIIVLCISEFSFCYNFSLFSFIRFYYIFHV